MKNLEIKTIEHKGIKVAILVDYDRGVVSLVERDNNYGNKLGWKPKSYMFANRQPEYVRSWKNILEAMQEAVAYGESELQRVQDTRKQDITEMILKNHPLK